MVKFDNFSRARVQVKINRLWCVWCQCYIVALFLGLCVARGDVYTVIIIIPFGGSCQSYSFSLTLLQRPSSSGTSRGSNLEQKRFYPVCMGTRKSKGINII